ncbi:hypothetical protein [Saccharothrix sp. HUAS TT1]|uniref:hypothetical protein n=1 Tax=unclassified Saccharothrix TaxID=2593673 RepID=UPI00345B9464
MSGVDAPRLRPGQYAEWECLEERNFYGGPIVDPGHYEGVHRPAFVPAAAGLPPWCSCGWTRVPKGGGLYVELVEHIADQGRFGSMLPDPGDDAR